VIKLYPVWLEQLRNNHQIGAPVASSSASQHLDLMHTPTVHHHVAVVANSDSDSLATPSNGRGSMEPVITFSQSDHCLTPVHTPQNNIISLVSSSSGE